MGMLSPGWTLTRLQRRRSSRTSRRKLKLCATQSCLLSTKAWVVLVVCQEACLVICQEVCQVLEMQVLDQTSRKLTNVNTYISYIYLTSPVNSRNSGIIKIFSQKK